MLGHSIATIQKATGIRYERVIKTINFYEPNRVPPPSAKNGRPKKISNDALNRITVLTLQDRGIPCWLISKKLQDEGFNGLSTTTVWRERVNLGFEFKPPKDSAITQRHTEKMQSRFCLCDVKLSIGLIKNNIFR